MAIQKWSQDQHKELLKTPVFTITSHLSGNGVKSGTFYKIHAPNWINVIAFTEDEQVILIKQYRQGTDKVTIEIPGGAIDENEDPLVAAKRELLEETGFASEEWTSLGRTSVNPAIMNNYTFLFMAKKCKQIGKQQLDSMEEIEVFLVEKQEFFKKLVSEDVDHSLILAGVCKMLLLDR